MSKSHMLPPVKPIMVELSRVRAAHSDQFALPYRKKRALESIEELARATERMDAAVGNPEEEIDSYVAWRVAAEECEDQVSRSMNRQPPERTN
jgi:hypothetical protein